MSRVNPRNFLHLLGEWGSASFKVEAPDLSLMLMVMVVVVVVVVRREVYNRAERQSRRNRGNRRQ